MLTYPAIVNWRLDVTPIVPVTVVVPCRFSVTTGVGLVSVGYLIAVWYHL